jgi:hypothetical protein
MKRAAEWEIIEPGSILHKQGEKIKYVYVIAV